MFLTAYHASSHTEQSFLSPESSQDILSGHSETLIEHILHHRTVHSGHLAEFRESLHLPPEAFLLRQEPAEFVKILLCFSFHDKTAFKFHRQN